VEERKDEREEILSKALTVAAKIHECEEKGEKVWFTKLSELLKDEMSPSTVLKALRTAFDWGIVKGQYGETDAGRPGRLLYIPGESKETIREIYEKFYKTRRP